MPAPGLPDNRRLCPPAAATSRARLACSCPRTSARSCPITGRSSSRSGRPLRENGGIGSSPLRCCTRARSDGAPMTWTSSIRAASGASEAGTMTVPIPFARANDTSGSTPFVWRIAPSRESSPRKRVGLDGSSTAPEAARMPSAIGTSNAAPSLRTSAGARLIVILRAGKVNPVCRIAARTRSLASCTAASGKPTTVTAGNPCARSTSTSTSAPSRPTTLPVWTLATIGMPLVPSLRHVHDTRIRE